MTASYVIDASLERGLPAVMWLQLGCKGAFASGHADAIKQLEVSHLYASYRKRLSSLSYMSADVMAAGYVLAIPTTLGLLTAWLKVTTCTGACCSVF
jgi:hypothetical protein